jgi:two-component system phosphate regulon response regulator OmpR
MTTSASILVVEDDEDIRQLIAEYLGAQGYAVQTAATGAQARECLLAERPQLVILDIGLPDDDGLAIARHVREQLDIAIIIVSGSNEPIDRIVGLEVGSDDYLSKPFDIRELRARVKNVLRRYRAAVTPSVATTPDPRRIELGRGMFDLDARMLIDAQGEEIPLTASEYDMLNMITSQLIQRVDG